MSKALTVHELREIKAHLLRIHVGPAGVDRFLHLMARIEENIAPKPEKKSA